MRQTKILMAVVAVGVVMQVGCSHEGYRPPRERVMAPVGVEVSDWSRNCRTDLDCGAYGRCISPAGAAMRSGVCGAVVDSDGVRLAAGPRAVPSCTARQDCPLAFSCLQVSMLYGLCVK